MFRKMMRFVERFSEISRFHFGGTYIYIYIQTHRRGGGVTILGVRNLTFRGQKGVQKGSKTRKKGKKGPPPSFWGFWVGFGVGKSCGIEGSKNTPTKSN